MRIITTSRYERAIRKLMSKEDRRAMEAVIVADPGAAPVIPGTVAAIKKEETDR